MRKLLLIDDDLINTKALAARLERRGFHTTILNDGINILEHLHENQYDLILLDIIMPTLNGDEILKIIRTEYDRNQLPIIVVSSVNDTKDISESFRNGVNDYLAKPVNVDVAEARIGAHIDSANKQKAEINKRELEAISAMVITYNHELNNPLAIALATLELIKECPDKIPPTQQNNLRESLKRIADIVGKMRDLSASSQLNFTNYASNKKMVKL